MHHFGDFIVNFEHVSHLVLVSLLITFDQVHAEWDILL